MSSIPEIRHRIRAVEDTRKITRAMYLISSAKMQKAMRMWDKNRAYFDRIREQMHFILCNTDAGVQNPYFDQRPGRRAVYLVVAGDKGMCGSYNEDVLRLADQAIREGRHAQVSLFTIGLMAYAHFAKLGMDPDVQYLHIAQNPDLPSARGIALELCEMYDRQLFDEAYIVFTNMRTSRLLKPEVMRLLPVLAEDFPCPAEPEPPVELEFIPSEKAALNALVPQHLIGLVYSACVQAFASEQSARMTAMDASTRNADEMLGKLTMEHNRARQSAITQELNEITSGANSVLAQ